MKKLVKPAKKRAVFAAYLEVNVCSCNVCSCNGACV